jgi:hypothetical protein
LAAFHTEQRGEEVQEQVDRWYRPTVQKANLSDNDGIRVAYQIRAGKKERTEEDEVALLQRIDAMNADVWEANRVLVDLLAWTDIHRENSQIGSVPCAKPT